MRRDIQRMKQNMFFFISSMMTRCTRLVDQGVVPLHKGEISESAVVTSTTSEEISRSHRNRVLSLIRKQFVQIENQQSSVFDLLQVYSWAWAHCLAMWPTCPQA